MVLWETETDWDGVVSESGVAHEAVANSDHVDAGVVKRGYSVAEPLFADALVGYWPLQEDSDGTAYDFSGHDNDASVSGATQGRSGLLGTTAYSFDGVDDYLSSPSDAAWAGTSNWTVAFWVLFEEFSTTRSCFNTDDLGNNSGDTALQLRSANRRLRSVIDWNSGGGDVFSNAEIQLDRWYHVAVLSDHAADEGSIYIDGSLDASEGGISGNLGGSGQALEIGGNNNTENFLAGSMWDFRLYDRALSAAEIQALYDVVATPGTIATAPKEVQ